MTLNLNRNERSVMAQFRCGVLTVETGRFIGEAVDTRICKLCNQRSVEEETHFLQNCQCYTDIRDYETTRIFQTKVMMINFQYY